MMIEDVNDRKLMSTFSGCKLDGDQGTGYILANPRRRWLQFQNYNHSSNGCSDNKSATESDFAHWFNTS